MALSVHSWHSSNGLPRIPTDTSDPHTPTMSTNNGYQQWVPTMGTNNGYQQRMASRGHQQEQQHQQSTNELIDQLINEFNN